MLLPTDEREMTERQIATHFRIVEKYYELALNPDSEPTEVGPATVKAYITMRLRLCLK